MATHSDIIAWKIHGQRNLAGCGPQGCRESGMTEATQPAPTMRVSLMIQMVKDLPAMLETQV